MKIVIVQELPQWIISSDVAAYHPATRTIYCRKDKWWYIAHELGHWLGCKMGEYGNWVHNWLDNSLSR